MCTKGNADMPAIMAYVTVPHKAEAEKIAAAVVTDRLAACANILSGMQSIYHWQGKIETAEEVVLIFKTRDTLFAPLAAKVKELHSYETPCIIALPVTAADQDYLDWILAETKP